MPAAHVSIWSVRILQFCVSSHQQLIVRIHFSLLACSILRFRVPFKFCYIFLPCLECTPQHYNFLAMLCSSLADRSTVTQYKSVFMLIWYFTLVFRGYWNKELTAYGLMSAGWRSHLLQCFVSMWRLARLLYCLQHPSLQITIQQQCQHHKGGLVNTDYKIWIEHQGL